MDELHPKNVVRGAKADAVPASSATKRATAVFIVLNKYVGAIGEGQSGGRGS